MPRNGSGTYSVPNVFTPNTIISSSSVNSNFSDAGSALTDSLARDGQGGMTGQLKATDGTVSLPGMGFLNDLNTGFRRSGVDEMRVVTGGADRAYWDVAGKLFQLFAMDVAGATNLQGLLTAVNATLTGTLTGVASNFTGAKSVATNAVTPLTLRRTETAGTNDLASWQGGDGTGNKAIWQGVCSATALTDLLMTFGGNEIFRLTSDRHRATRQIFCPQATLTDAANISWNWDTQQTAIVTLTADRTLNAPTNAQAGSTGILVLNATGANRNLTLGFGYVLPSGVVDPFLILNGSKNIMSVYYDGVDYYASPSLGFVVA